MSEEQKGQNVKVVLRCRPMSAAEHAKEKPVVKCIGDKSVEINYSHLGKGHKKAFGFDGVFDPSTEQKDIYDNVVRPVVDEVLQGYNCTVFAYGQTGTGKTYTMEGQFSEAKGKDQPHAGIVPRAVAQVFKYLEENELEYQVRISVVELYNEELSDLIAAGDDESTGKLRKLRLLEDPKKGIVLQGVEERPVNTAGEIFHILEGTNKQRRTAETLCNKQSSRSHSIFTLKIFMREKALDDEEVIKTGLLHLVDLAGSECVGRSGAQGDRKKEAGQINQSLLTLGRVITALVEHQPHVPYRESKLTRLLQESLGGKTKTCIIATVSPGSSNIEETLSTLDYACRAKNIKNTPEINQVSTKKTMMRDMARSISELQEQLKAQREAHGVYLPAARYQGMQDEIDRLRQDEEIMQKELEEKQKQYEELQASFTETVQELQATQLNLEETQGALEETQGALTTTQTTLSVTEGKLEDVSVVLGEHKSVGDDLYSEGVSLLHTSEGMREDLGGLFGKLARKSAVETGNLQAARAYKSELQVQVAHAADELSAFKDDQAGRFKALQRQVAEFVVEKKSEMDRIAALLAALQHTAAARLEESHERTAEHAAEASAAVDATAADAALHREETHHAVHAGVESLVTTAAELTAELRACSGSVATWGQAVASHVEGNMSRVLSFASDQQRRLQALADAAAAASAEHERALQAQEEAVATATTESEASLAGMQARVLEGVRAMLAGEGEKHSAELRDRNAAVQAQLKATREGMCAAREQLVVGIDECNSSVRGLSAAMQAGGEAELRQGADANAATLEQIRGCEERVRQVASGAQQCESAVSAAHAEQRERMVQARRERAQALDAARSDDRAMVTAAQGEVETQARAVEEAVAGSGASAGERGERAARAVDAQAEAMQNHYITAQAQLTRLGETPLPLAQDEPTGRTPVKRDIALPAALPRFRPDEEVLAEHHGYAYNPNGERVSLEEGEEGDVDEGQGGEEAGGGVAEEAVPAAGGEESKIAPVAEEEAEEKRQSGGSVQSARSSAGSDGVSERRGRAPVREKTAGLSRIPSLRSRDKENRNTLNTNC